MKYTTEDILNNMIVEAFNHLSYAELTERLAMFFRHYMPVTALAAYVYFEQTIVKLSEYSCTNTAMGPDKLNVDTVGGGIPETVYGDDYEVRIRDAKGPYGEIYAALYATMPTTSLYIPLVYYRSRVLFLSVTAYGEDRYTEDHVALCRLIRPALSVVVGNMASGQRVDLRDLDALQALSRFDGRDAAPASAPASEPETFCTLDTYTVDYIRRVLSHTGGRVAGKNGAAAILGVHVSTLWSKIRKFNIPVRRD